MSRATTLPSRAAGAGPPADHASAPGGVLALTTSLLTDRMFLYTDFLTTLRDGGAASVWAGSAAGEGREAWAAAPVPVAGFPPVRAFREFPHNYMRRLNEFAWDFRLRPPSRLSMDRWVRRARQPLSIRSLAVPARAIALLGAEGLLERGLEALLLTCDRSPEAERRLARLAPAAVLSTGPFQFEQPGVLAAARRLGIPVLAMIPSWDNVSTKSRMVFHYDGYVVWSEGARDELRRFYPRARNAPVYVVGAPQFDVFFQERFAQTREEFCAGQGLDPRRPIVVHAVGSPNFLQERHGALFLAARVAAGDLGDAQLLVRPHPIHDDGMLGAEFAGFGPSVVVQRTSHTGAALTARTQSEAAVCEWVNTFRHAEVVVNLSSTVTVDAAVCDRPVVNLDYDPEPGRPNQELVKDVNHRWSHFSPIACSGGVWLVDGPGELIGAVKTYLERPDLHRAGREAVVRAVCGRPDGRSGRRLAEALLDFAARAATRGGDR